MYATVSIMVECEKVNISNCNYVTVTKFYYAAVTGNYNFYGDCNYTLVWRVQYGKYTVCDIINLHIVFIQL